MSKIGDRIALFPLGQARELSVVEGMLVGAIGAMRQFGFLEDSGARQGDTVRGSRVVYWPGCPDLRLTLKTVPGSMPEDDVLKFRVADPGRAISEIQMWAIHAGTTCDFEEKVGEHGTVHLRDILRFAVHLEKLEARSQ